MAQSATETLTDCPVCGAAAAEHVLALPDAYVPILHLYRCSACGIVYLNPRLAPAGTVAVESESEIYHYSAEETEGIIVKLQDFLARMSRFGRIRATRRSVSPLPASY